MKQLEARPGALDYCVEVSLTNQNFKNCVSSLYLKVGETVASFCASRSNPQSCSKGRRTAGAALGCQEGQAQWRVRLAHRGQRLAVMKVQRRWGPSQEAPLCKRLAYLLSVERKPKWSFLF